jgi:glycosyltransferase involved in cell wall biosynthesis
VHLCLFTDTLADVNGVSRFIQNIAARAHACGRRLTVVTSTRLPLPTLPGVVNLPPLLAGRIPGYAELEVALPMPGRTGRLIRGLAPDAVHVSTPGPVGLLGRRIARRFGLPLAGTYHTDFPAYLDHLFEDRCLTWLTRAAMSRFYRPFDAVLTRSRAYGAAVAALGVAPGRIISLAHGIDTGLFSRRRRDPSVWEREGVPAGAVKVLFVGRVSVEKNLPMLARAWRPARARCAKGGVEARLIVVGDGPYKEAMERELAGGGAHFLGFRHGEDLARLYASADLFVFPSATDTLGQVVLEAQASGLPTLVSDRGGPQGLVRHGIGGLILPASGSCDWSDAIAALACDPARQAVMGAAALAGMDGCSIDASFQHFWSVHEGLVRGRAAFAAGRR